MLIALLLGRSGVAVTVLEQATTFAREFPGEAASGRVSTSRRFRRNEAGRYRDRSPAAIP
jgi:2-polyprenyl-6-methoxyphenol hydroxylase-like FAD-dependent oxidoreductase